MDLSVRTETFGESDQSWIAARHGIEMSRSITLDTSAFVEATHYPSGYIRSGTPLGRITATGLYAPYSDVADSPAGTGVLAGFLLDPVKPGDPTTVDVQGALYEHGAIVRANLPIAIDSTGVTDIADKISVR